MALTGEVLLRGFSDFIGDLWEDSTSSAGNAGGTTLVDTDLSRFGDDTKRDWFFRITEAGDASIWEARAASDFASSTGTATVAPAYSGQIGSAKAYDMHRFDPKRKFAALDRARLIIYPILSRLIYNDTITADGRSSTFDIPAAIRSGPLFVFEEAPLEINPQWNFIQDPVGDSTSNWTATNLTAGTFDSNANDLEVPKYGFTATTLTVAASTNGTYDQTVANMTNDITAALAAGRQMTFAMWVYSRLADKVALKIIDDSATTTGTQHGGKGWELLTVTADEIDATNATTLTARLDVDNDANAFDGAWQHGWFYFGNANRVQDIYPERNAHRVRRDGTTQRVSLDWVPQRGHQLRLIGRDVLSALGTTASTQVTNTMEIDAIDAELLYAKAARVLFEEQGINSDQMPDIFTKIQLVEERFSEYAPDWGFRLPALSPIPGPWR